MNSDNTLNSKNISKFDESELSEISVEDEIDCSTFCEKS